MPVRRTTYPRAGETTLADAARRLGQAQRPLVLAGNGVIRRQASGHGASDALAEFAARLSIPVTHTFMGKGALDHRDPCALPAVGLLRPGADLAILEELAQADIILAVGYDLVEWAPVAWNQGCDKEIIHIDSTPAEIDGHYLPAVEVVGEIADSLRTLAELCEGPPRGWWSERGGPSDTLLARLARYAADDSVPLKPQRVVWDLRQALGDEDILISDVGAHKVWLARLFPTRRPNTVVISNGFASMGIAVPGGVAAALARPGRKVVAVSGDGGFLMNSQELETARRLGTPFVNVVWTDGRYGLIELNQRRQFGSAFGVEFGDVDLIGYAAAFGLPAWPVKRAGDLLPTLRRALDLDRPSLIAVPVDAAENARLAERI
jgi:acetolactate synthase-1/2/3 large subunit